MTHFKICCIQDVGEMEAAVRHGADAVGLVSEMPSGPGVIDEDRIAEIADRVPEGTDSVLLTSRTDPAEVADQVRRCGTDAVQLCDRLEGGTGRDPLGDLRRRLPGVKILQVVHVTGPEAVEVARAGAGGADALLLDSGRPDAEVRELGGTGRAHDWTISRRIREAVEVPVFLAGGLGPDNVGAAIRRVRPYAVDVCSGLRDDGGRLVETRLAEFAAEVRAATA